MLPMELKFSINWEYLCEGRDLCLDEMVYVWTTKTKISNFKTGILYGVQSGTENFSNCDIEQYKKSFKSLLKRDGLSKLNVFYALHEAYGITIGQDLNKIKVIIEFPGRATMLNQLAKDFQNSKFIEIVRDPRANFMSIKTQILNSNGNFVQRRRLGYSNLLIKAIKDLKLDYQQIEKFPFVRKKEKWFQLKNEDLHSDYETTVSSLADWLKISFKPCLNESTLGGHPWLGNSSSGKPVKGKSLEVINRWKSEISFNEKKLIEYFFGKYIESYSYNCIGKNSFDIKTLFLPLKGELSIAKKTHKPKGILMLYLWNLNPLIVITLRYILRLDKMLLSPIFYLQSRLWIITNLIRKNHKKI